MTAYLLDTNVWSHWLRSSSKSVVARANIESNAGRIWFCSIVKAELTYGVIKEGRPSKRSIALERFFRAFPSLPFDDRCCEAYGQIRATLERRGKSIGRNDLLIASIAMANDLTVVTHNTSEFTRVPGLAVEDWQTD